MTIPKHRQIAARLRTMALAAPGQPLPGEIELSKRWKVSRSTVRMAFGSLVADGLVERRRRSGTVAKPLIGRLDAWQSFRTDMAAQGVEVVDRHLVLSRESNRIAAKILHVAPDSRLWVLDRVRGDGGGPIACFRSWFAPSVPIAEDDDPAGPLWERLSSRGCLPARSRDEIRAVPADSSTAEALEVAVGTPLLERRRLVLDASGSPLEWNIGRYRTDRFAMTTELVVR